MMLPNDPSMGQDGDKELPEPPEPSDVLRVRPARAPARKKTSKGRHTTAKKKTAKRAAKRASKKPSKRVLRKTAKRGVKKTTRRH
jgi:hypothetical protein